MPTSEVQISSDLSADEARALTEKIKASAAELLPLIREAFERRADVALGYASWQAYCDAELMGLRLPVGERRTAVAELRSAGMSTRAIGAALGVSDTTVVRDLASTASGEAVDDQPVTAGPQPVTGLDGRQRPASRPEPAGQREARAAYLASDAGWTPPTEKPHVEDDARRDAELDAEMAGTVQRFRTNFASARVRAGEIVTFDAERINEVFADNWDREVGDLLTRLDEWIGHVRDGHRARQRAGLRLVGGAR